ncbi:hypothetical protein MNBD_GAMMA18-1262 [hydrothermal vent metagenome]|uniref:Putative zinc-finger domain-containing protein n=1 Tax=hydrothermal vent metagenome TaxID=652676 RepID=A0A3B0ZIN4_9ZZZZ
MLSCKELTEQAGDYLDKQLPLSKKLQLKMHLLLCLHCRCYLKQLRTTIRLIKMTPQIINDEKAQQIVDEIFNHQIK